MASKKLDQEGALQCTNCGIVGSPYACSRCKMVHYCSKACQEQHWKATGGHKRFCVPKEQRKPQPTKSKQESLDDKSSRNCAICLENVSVAISCTLHCFHTFHIKCVKSLRALNVTQTCPTCRAQLPRDLENLFKNVTSLVFHLKFEIILNMFVLWTEAKLPRLSLLGPFAY